MSGRATMANWDLLAEALSVLQGRCGNNVTGIAYLCCFCLRSTMSVLYHVRQTRYTFDFCISVYHVSLGNNFSFRAYRYILVLPCLVSTCAFCPGSIRYTIKYWRRSNGNVTRLLSYRYDTARRIRYTYFYFFLTQNTAYEGTSLIVRWD
jgi:hypothetical protein